MNQRILNKTYLLELPLGWQFLSLGISMGNSEHSIKLCLARLKQTGEIRRFSTTQANFARSTGFILTRETKLRETQERHDKDVDA